MANLLTAPFTQFVDGNGNPLSGGKVYTYVTGASLTPKATYTDSSAATPLSNPVILDSNGSAVIWLSGEYRIQVKDANDVLIHNVDNVAQDSSATTSFSDATFTLFDDADATKKAAFQLSDITTGNTRVISVPDSNITLVGAANPQTLTNKSLSDSTTFIVDDSDVTKKAQFQCSTIATATTRTYTFPNKDGTLAMTSDIAASGVVANSNFTGATAGSGGVNFSGNLSKNRTGTGVYVFTFGTAQPDTNYQVYGNGLSSTANKGLFFEVSAKTTSGFTVTVYTVFTAAVQDPTTVDISVLRY